MILSGAFDCFGKHRSQLMRVYPEIVERVSSDKKSRASGQFSIFDMGMGLLEPSNIDIEVNYPNIQEYDNDTKLKLEKEVVGVYISGHPLDNYMDKYNIHKRPLKNLQKEKQELLKTNLVFFWS
jgi:DNA polymerase-3 subunit alpha